MISSQFPLVVQILVHKSGALVVAHLHHIVEYLNVIGSTLTYSINKHPRTQHLFILAIESHYDARICVNVPPSRQGKCDSSQSQPDLVMMQLNFTVYWTIRRSTKRYAIKAKKLWKDV